MDMNDVMKTLRKTTDSKERSICKRRFKDLYADMVKNRMRSHGLSRKQAIRSVNLEIYLRYKESITLDRMDERQYLPSTFDSVLAWQDATRLGLIGKHRELTKLGKIVLNEIFCREREKSKLREDPVFKMFYLSLENYYVKLDSDPETDEAILRYSLTGRALFLRNELNERALRNYRTARFDVYDKALSEL